MINITRDKIENSQLLPEESDPQTGATVLFLGTAREFTEYADAAGTTQRQSSSLEYEAYEEMAVAAFKQLAEQAQSKWPIHQLNIVHRLGKIALGETCVAIAVSCPHRRDAFEAAQWLMDRTKEVVPIWKKENWASGSSEWVHPVTDEVQRSAGQ